MSERGYWKINTSYKTAEFKIFDTSNNLVTGRAASLTSALFLNEATSAQAVTFTETATAGIYYATYTPNALGRWTLFIVDPTNNVRGWQDDVIGVNNDSLDVVFDASGNLVAIATGAVSAAAIAAAAGSKLADIIWRRQHANIRASSDGDAVVKKSPFGASQKLANKTVVSGGTLTTYQEDDATPSFTQAIATDPSANPIVSAG